MGKVTINPAVTETKVVEVSPATYTLELNEQEFVAIMVLVGMVGGELEGIRNDALTPLWKSVFRQSYLDNYAFKGDTIHKDYRSQIKGNIYV